MENNNALCEALEGRKLLAVGPIPAVPTAQGYWPFDDGAGTTAVDASGNGKTATLGAGAGWIGGNVGTRAMSVNGTAPALATVSGPIVNTADSFTVSAWVQLSTLGGYQTVVSIAGANVAGFYLQLRGDTGTFAFTRPGNDSTAPGGAIAASNIAPTAGTWYHLVGVHDSAADTIALYVDGQLASSVAYASGWTASGDTLIGHGLWNAQQVDFVNGSIDEVSMYAIALTPAQVAALDHPADYSFDDGAGTTAADVSGHGNTLTLGSGATWVAGHTGSNAIAVDGSTNSFASFPSPVVDTSRPFSVSAWVKLNTLSGFQTFASIDGVNTSGFNLQLRGDTGRFAFTRLASDSGGVPVYRADAQAAPVAGQWYHLLGVSDVASGQIGLYVDGVLQSSANAPNAWQATGATVVGAAKFNGGRVDQANAHIDDVRFYNSPLSASAAAFAPYIGGTTQAILNVAADTNGIIISPDLFGLFMEDINYGGEGGVYNDLVRNGGFNDVTNPLNAWAAVSSNGVIARLTSDATTGPTAALNKSGKLTITSGVSASKRAGISNSGFFGVGIAPSTAYEIEFYAKASPGFSGPLAVSLESNDGTVYAAGVVSAVTTAWAKYELTLTTGADVPTSSANRIVISTNSPSANGATIWFGSVHVFPPSYMNSPAHLRVDLMEKLAALKPAFFRVPGGNYLEGVTYADRFNWRETIGRIEDRPGHFNSAWGYWSSDGMGLDEYLQMAELLDARPVLGVFAGYTLNGQSSTGAQLAADVQDALDQLHYVLDPVTTPWGALRAANGHAAPYDVREVEIGNEDFFSSTYATRYPLFYDAIRAEFPQLKIIASHTDTGGRPYDILDEHYYIAPAGMQSRQDFYDSRPRGGAEIFVGEWASMEGNPTNNMNAALGDAVWLMGIMENSDLVTMQSYAPLWANVNGVQWVPDLIGYDNTLSYGSPGYYVQAMLASHSGETVVSNNLAGGAGSLRTMVTKTDDTYYVAVVNVGGSSIASQLNLSGVSTVWPTGTATTLSAASLGATNWIGDPEAIVPVTSTVSGLGASFSYTFPAYSFTILQLTATNAPLPAAPIVLTPANAAPSDVTGTTTTLSVLGSQGGGGESGLTYTWASVSTPPAPVTFSANGTNAAKNTVATFAMAGNYQFEVTIANPNGRTTTSTVSVGVQQTASEVKLSHHGYVVDTGTTLPLVGNIIDQFGLPMANPPSGITWAISSGAGNINSSGIYSAPGAPGVATISATAADIGSDVANITIVSNLDTWYRLEGATGGVIADAGIRNNVGGLNGSYSIGNGVRGNALSLAGGAHASLPAGIVNNLNDFTIATWMRVTSLANWARVFDFGSGTGVNMFMTPSAGGTNRLRFAITTSGAGGEQRLDGPAIVPDEWTHVAVTIVGTTATLYVNGGIFATRYNTMSPTAMGETTANYLGRSQYAADPAFSGSIDEFRIYSRGLSAAEIQSLAGPQLAYALNGRLYVDFDRSAPITLGTSGPGGNVTVAAGGGGTTLGFDPATFADIVITGTTGGDTLTIAGVMPRPVSFAGSNGSDTLSIGAAGSALFASDLGAATTNLSVQVNGEALFDSTQHLSSLTVTGAAAMAAGGEHVLVVGTLSINGAGMLDLRDNTLLVTAGAAGSFDGTAYDGVQGLVQRAYNFGAWDQPGLTTSMLEAGQNAGPLSNTTTIAVATASQVLFIAPTETGVFAGQTVTGATVIAMYTYAGDLNFDGLADGADYGVIDNYVQFAGTAGYVNGDFNYDGVIDGADYGIIDNSNQLQGDPFPLMTAAPTAVQPPAASKDDEKEQFGSEDFV